MIASSVIQVFAEDELKRSYLEYSTAIFNRALPSAVDGLKVAQRRIIQGLKELNLKPEGQYKKVSRLEGHVLGTLHPQGGCAGTAINMGMTSAFRYPLTNIHGNVGGSIQSGKSVGQSISEDAPAAARYLEVKSSSFTQKAFIEEVDKYSCKWRDNYDGSTQEVEEIVPALPALLVNGAQGIAAGYACHHVPYNFTEVVRGTVEFIKNPKITNKALHRFITAPDLPNGARILNDGAVFEAFERGAGTLKLYGTWEVKKIPHGKRSTRDAIIITSLASGSSEKFLEKLKDGVESEKIIGVIDASDHSSRDGIEIQVVLKSGINPNEVISQLLAFTNLHDTLGVNATAISGKLPTIFGVKDLIEEWYGARCVALKLRYEAEIEKLQARNHILEGLLTVLADIDGVVKVIRASKTKDEASAALQKRWGLSQIQASAVLSMPLSRLVNVESLELRTEQGEILAKIAELTAIITDPAAMATHICSQLKNLKEFSDKRRSGLVEKSEIGVEKAKVVTIRGVRKPKMASPKEKIKLEGKALGMRRMEINKFFSDNAGNTNLKDSWEEYKKEWKHTKSLTTHKGRAERKAALEALKANAIARGLPKRGQFAWNAFIAGKEKNTLENIKSSLEEWINTVE